MNLKLAGKMVKFADVDLVTGDPIVTKATIAKGSDEVMIPVAIKSEGDLGEEIIEFRLIPLSMLEEDI